MGLLTQMTNPFWACPYNHHMLAVRCTRCKYGTYCFDLLKGFKWWKRMMVQVWTISPCQHHMVVLFLNDLQGKLCIRMRNQVRYSVMWQDRWVQLYVCDNAVNTQNMDPGQSFCVHGNSWFLPWIENYWEMEDIGSVWKTYPECAPRSHILYMHDNVVCINRFRIRDQVCHSDNVIVDQIRCSAYNKWCLCHWGWPCSRVTVMTVNFLDVSCLESHRMRDLVPYSGLTIPCRTIEE
jgi:hypothetical protein